MVGDKASSIIFPHENIFAFQLELFSQSNALTQAFASDLA
jgi:hypothetical protein